MKKKYFHLKLHKHKIRLILLFVLVVLIAIIFIVVLIKTKSHKAVHVEDNNIEIINKTMSLIENPGMVQGNKDDLIAFSIAPNTRVSGLVSYRGIVKGGYFFEGNILINVLDPNKKKIIQSNIMATTDWMTAGPVEFEGYLDFSNIAKGGVYIEIHNDNASGFPKNDKSILIPIIIE